jgi:hypothetical protein
VSNGWDEVGSPGRCRMAVSEKDAITDEEYERLNAKGIR